MKRQASFLNFFTSRPQLRQYCIPVYQYSIVELINNSIWYTECKNICPRASKQNKYYSRTQTVLEIYKKKKVFGNTRPSTNGYRLRVVLDILKVGTSFSRGSQLISFEIIKLERVHRKKLQ